MQAEPRALERELSYEGPRCGLKALSRKEEDGGGGKKYLDFLFPVLHTHLPPYPTEVWKQGAQVALVCPEGDVPAQRQ